MKRIGFFKKDGNTYVGSITLLHMHVRARIIPVREKTSSIAPDYLVVQGQETNAFAAELGLAWQKQTRHGEIPFLAVKIDDPLCPHPIHAVLWPGEGDDCYLYWDRNAGEGEPPEELFVQEELKVVLGTFRSFQRMTTERILQLFPVLAAG